MATLAAAHLAPVTVHGLYTYGCPRVGDTAFAGTLPEQSHYRFVHREDWVPTVPPELLGYVHAGTLFPVPGIPRRKFWDDMTSGTKAFASALKAMAKELKLRVGELP